MRLSKSGAVAVRTLVRIFALGGLILLVDVGTTPRRVAEEIRGLARRAPQRTSYMRVAEASGRPVREHEWVPLDSISPLAFCAVVMAEDEQFFQQGTLNWRMQRELALRMAHGDFSRGASGISQQLARNLFLTPERNVRRKLREYALAWALSRELAKSRQMELYLNVVEWGDGVWGIAAASRHYFGVRPSQLSSAQATVLASMLPAPRRGVGFSMIRGVATKQEAIAFKLWRTRLLTDLGLTETIDRLREFRTQLRMGKDSRTAWNDVERLMGPDGLQSERLPGAHRPYNLTCDLSRRGL